MEDGLVHSCTSQHRRGQLVLILIVVEDGLVQDFKMPTGKELEVLILIVVEDGLVLLLAKQDVLRGMS